MNKQKYLAELQRLLVFMTEEDRELTVRRYGEIFDAAGPDGEDAVTASLGTPTKAAIELSRGYTEGSAALRLPPVPRPPAPEPEPEPAPAPEVPQDPWEDIPDYEVPETPLTAAEKKAAARTAARAPAATPAPARPVWTPEDEEIDDWPELPERRRWVEYERSVPLGLGIPLFILLLLALGIPLALLCAALTVVFLAPGCAVIFGAYLVFVGGLWCLSIVADAILLFGAALVVLALGLLVLWVGLWLAVNIWKLWGKGLVWVIHELLGRKVTVYE